ncbi:MAG: ACT domain-containing protein [Nocardioidaceae bacterium]
MPTLVLTLLGTDRAGLVSAVSGVISERGGSWERSQMVHLSGTFAGVVEVDVPAGELDGLIADVEGLAAEGLRVTVERSEPAPVEQVSGQRLALQLVGADRPGIVAEVSSLLAEHGANVEELSSRVISAPMAGGTIFEAEVTIGLPEGADSADLVEALESLANELMVDLEFDTSD